MEAPSVAPQSEGEPEEYTVIIDIGQGSTKVGFAGEEKPRSVFPTVTGKPRYQQMMAGVNVQDIYVGDDTTRMRGVLKLDYPINRGNVMDWNQYFAILNHIFYNVLRIDSSKCHIIYLVPPLTPPDTAIYFARVLFETHRVKSVAILDSASTAVFSVGETVALSIEMGTGLTHVTPVMNGQIYDPSIQRLYLAGSDIEDYLEKLLTTYGNFQKREIVKEIKEQACKIALDPNASSQNQVNSANFILPDGESMQINAYVATYAGEVLFNPSLLGPNIQSLQQAIINSLRMVDPYYWRPLLKKIILSGGTSYFKGLKERIEKEVELLLPQLGPLPPPTKEEPPPRKDEKRLPAEEPKSKQLVQVTTHTKGKAENCPKCGELLEDQKSEFCPFCGHKMENQIIEIMGSAKKKYPEKCPKCNEKLDGESSFCPSCGAKLEPMIIQDDKLDRKEKKLMKKAAVGDDIKEIQKMVDDEYGSGEELEEIAAMDVKKPEEKKDDPMEDPNKIVRVILPEDRLLASFKGAAILGSLPSLKKFMIDFTQYQQNPYSVIVDFSKVLNFQ
jgi:actin-related protein